MPKVASIDGAPIDVEFAGVDSVAELRRRVASVLKVPPSWVKLLMGDTVLEDSAPPDSRVPDGVTIMALVSNPGPSWYPPRKYVHEGNWVLKITWRKVRNRGLLSHECQVHYVDGTVLAKSEEGSVYGKDKAEAARIEAVSTFAKGLADEFGFVTHKTLEYSDQPYRETTYEAVPAEDPDEWEYWSNGYDGSGMRRRPTPASSLAAAAVEPTGVAASRAPTQRPAPDFSVAAAVVAPTGVAAIARQADGMPGVAFRLGCRNAEPLLDVLNGSTIRCLAEDGEWIAAWYMGQVGFVKQRNIDLGGETCQPFALLGRVVAAQADGYPTVAFYFGKISPNPAADIPNGTEMACLYQQDDCVVVHWNDQLGYVKKRNVTALPTA